MQQPLTTIAIEVAELLRRHQTRIVIAESCTAGLVSATLARVPGISELHCGSAVVYRLETKTRWLGVPSSTLIDPGPVSEPVARAMAEGVLQRTPEANVAAAITGHLGPNSPPEQDGLAFVAIARRDAKCSVSEHWLPKFDNSRREPIYPGETEREQRQWAATEIVLSQLIDFLHSQEARLP